MRGIHLIYKGKQFSGVDIKPVKYKSQFFQIELDMESDVFYKLRLMNNITPARINESPGKDLEEIRDFFYANRNNFYFLFSDNNQLIGSVLHIRNYIQSLGVAKKFQRQGFGEKLSKYCISQILKKGYPCVELDILPGNVAALALYKKLGFTGL